MRFSILRPATLALLLCLPTTSGCATVLATAAGPITGGVDLSIEYGGHRRWYLIPILFVGGAIAGPFKAFYDGVNHDASIFANFTRYWVDFDDVFRPFRR